MKSYKRPPDMVKCVDSVEDFEKLTAKNYKDFNHSLLYIEETEQYHALTK